MLNNILFNIASPQILSTLKDGCFSYFVLQIKKLSFREPGYQGNAAS